MQIAKSDPMNANAKMKKVKVSKAAGTSSANGTDGQNSNWFGSPNNKGTQTTNNDWFGGNANNNTAPKGKKTTSAATSKGSNNDWFGSAANNSPPNGTGTARKGKMTKANDTNNNWFAPSNGMSK
jgi:hypothetical protein